MKIETNQYYEQLDKKIRFIQEVQTRLKDIENQFLKTFHENELKIDYETKAMKMEASENSLYSFLIALSFFTLAGEEV